MIEAKCTSMEDLTKRQYVAEIERLNLDMEILRSALEVIEVQCGLNPDHASLTIGLVKVIVQKALKDCDD